MTISAGTNEAIAWMTVALWWTALLCLAAFVWAAGKRVGAGLVVLAPIGAAAMLHVVPALATREATTVAACVVIGVAIAVAARVDQGRRGSQLLLDVVSGLLVASWVLAATHVVLA